MNKDRAGSLAFGELASELVASGHGFRFQARGRSMTPTIEDGEILHIRPLEGRKLNIGDIVLFCAKGEFKAHRIVKRQGNCFITRGDAGQQMDKPITRDQIVGLVFSKETTGGRLVQMIGLRARIHFFARETRRRVQAL